MITMLLEMVAAEQRAELRSAGEQSRTAAQVGQGRTRGTTCAIELRHAGRDDEEILAGLAALDEALPLHQPTLIASSDGRAIAAISLQDRRVVADPFVVTAQAVALLRHRADQLTRTRARRRLRLRLRRLRFA